MELSEVLKDNEFAADSFTDPDLALNSFKASVPEFSVLYMSLTLVNLWILSLKPKKPLPSINPSICKIVRSSAWKLDQAVDIRVVFSELFRKMKCRVIPKRHLKVIHSRSISLENPEPLWAVFYNFLQ